MTAFDPLLADYLRRFGDRLRTTEHRQVELYTKKKKLAFIDEPQETPLPSLLGVVAAFTLLDAHLAAANQTLENASGWARYLALPKTSVIDKLTAEVYRILRILHAVVAHPSGRLEVKDGAVIARATVNRCAQAVHISPPGLHLLETFVARRLIAAADPYPEAYVEAVLHQLFTDIVGETKRFADEDRILYQFRPRPFFNRHFRYDCDNPKFVERDDKIFFDIGELYADPARHPIDFFVVIDDALHVIPVEALTDGAVSVADLPRWRARTPDGQSLPGRFRQRFGRETMTPGLPMW